MACHFLVLFRNPAIILISWPYFCNGYLFFLKVLFILLLERREGRERERERNIYVRNIDWLPLTCPQLGTWPATQARALSGNWTGDVLVLTGVQSTDPHQPGCSGCLFSAVFNRLYLCGMQLRINFPIQQDNVPELLSFINLLPKYSLG